MTTSTKLPQQEQVVEIENDNEPKGHTLELAQANQDQRNYQAVAAVNTMSSLRLLFGDIIKTKMPSYKDAAKTKKKKRNRHRNHLVWVRQSHCSLPEIQAIDRP